MMLQKRENGVGAKMTHTRLEGNRIIGLNEEVNTMPAMTPGLKAASSLAFWPALYVCNKHHLNFGTHPGYFFKTEQRKSPNTKCSGLSFSRCLVNKRCVNMMLCLPRILGLCKKFRINQDK